MRRAALAALLFAGAPLLATGCATRAQPYRFASPMIGGADLPPPALRGATPTASAGSRSDALARRDAASHAAPAHVTTARGVAGIEAAPPPSASAEAADAVARSGVVWSQLPAPHRIAAEEPLPAPRSPMDLRALVGRRTKRDPFELAIGWTNAVGAARGSNAFGAARGSNTATEDSGSARAFSPVPVPPAITDHPDPSSRSSITGRAIARAAATAQSAATAGLAGSQLLAWARDAHVLHALDEQPEPGDLLVFDEIESDADADLIAVVIARDARGVTEFLYASGGVIRRGFVDANRPALRRDHEGLIVNTSMRSGRRWPPKGTHYLAGELLSHVIRAH